MALPRINWTVFKISLGVIYIALLFASGAVPYLSNSVVDIFFDYILSGIIFLYAIFLYAKNGENGSAFSRVYSGEIGGLGSGFFAVSKIVVFFMLFSFLTGHFSKYMLAYPTEILANHPASISGKILQNYGHSLSFQGFSKIELGAVDDGEDAVFFWPNKYASSLTPGACVSLRTNSWFLGANVEEVKIVSCRQISSISGSQP